MIVILCNSDSSFVFFVSKWYLTFSQGAYSLLCLSQFLAPNIRMVSLSGSSTF